MPTEDICWVQRLKHFSKALSQLAAAVSLATERMLSKLEEQGLIQAFEFTHELAWNTLRDFLEQRGVQSLYGSKDVTRAAFRAGLAVNGQVWMDMIGSRNLTSHTYDEATAARIASDIRESYCAEMEALAAKLGALAREEPA